MTLALGHHSVADCQRWVSSYEFTEWMAYMRIEPFGNDQVLSDAHFANLMALLANVNRDPKKRPKPFELDDFRLLKLRTDDDDDLQKRSQEDYATLRAGLIRGQK